MNLINLLLFGLGVVAFSLKELQSHGKLKWMDDPTAFWGSKSWVRKYKKDYGAATERDVPNNWYYRFFKIAWKEKFPLSATALVFLTDGYHLFQLLFKLCLISTVVTYQPMFNIFIDFLIYFLLFGLTFTITYKLLSK